MDLTWPFKKQTPTVSPCDLRIQRSQAKSGTLIKNSTQFLLKPISDHQFIKKKLKGKFSSGTEF